MGEGAREGVLVAITMLNGVGRKVGMPLGPRVGLIVLVGLNVGEAVTGASVVGQRIAGAFVVGEALGGPVGLTVGASVAIEGLLEGSLVAANRMVPPLPEGSVLSSRSGGRVGPNPAAAVGVVGGPVTLSHLSVNPPSLLNDRRHGSKAAACACDDEEYAKTNHRIARRCIAFDGRMLTRCLSLFDAIVLEVIEQKIVVAL